MPDIKSTIYYLKREQEEKHTEEAAQKLSLPYINLSDYPLTQEILNNVPEIQAIQYEVIPYLKVGKTIKVGVAEPNNVEVKKYLDEYSKSVGMEIVPALISKTSFLYGISFYEKFRKAEEEKKNKAGKTEEKNIFSEIKDIQSVAAATKKVNITELLDVIVAGAMRTKSSDIHLEPAENSFLVRYRIDGILQNVVVLSLNQYKQLVSRVKYLSKMRMDIANKPQDGRFSFKIENEDIDIRVSIMPATFGESLVLRLLGQEKSILDLDKLGFRPDALVAIKSAIARPYGMILNSGPTGSGKTSTLYAVLLALRKPGVKIITLENPVEYQIEGIEQSQIETEAGYEFTDALKASLRQDPDILMVGEIRDKETAEIAVQASLTGHLLLSTIHSNSAPAVFARLLEIGVKPFLLSGSINLVIAQRLVRKICPKCGETFTPRPEIWQEMRRVLTPIADRLSPEIQRLLSQDQIQLVRGKGCNDCGKTGFAGRQVITEVLVPSDSIESLVTKSASISEFEKTAAAEGMITMEQDGLSKVLEGITTTEEVWRVTRS